MIQNLRRHIELRLMRLFGRNAQPGLDEHCVSPDVRSVVEGGNLVLLDVEKGFMFKSNPTGARIWQGLLDRRPRRRIAEDLSLEFGVPRDVVEKDVDEFIADLESHGLLGRGSAG